MRLKIACLLLLAAIPAPSVAQTINCQLFGEDYGYGLFGTCRADAVQGPPITSVYSQPSCATGAGLCAEGYRGTLG